MPLKSLRTDVCIAPMQITNVLHSKGVVIFLKSVKAQRSSKEAGRARWGSDAVVYIDINLSQERHNFTLCAEVVEKIRKIIQEFTV